jgi:hypothetical protein
VCNRSYLESNGELHMVRFMVKMFPETLGFTFNIVVYECGFLLD